LVLTLAQPQSCGIAKKFWNRAVFGAKIHPFKKSTFHPCNLIFFHDSHQCVYIMARMCFFCSRLLLVHKNQKNKAAKALYTICEEIGFF